ncbi:NAD(P)/FAD-dependent oxidoreductase [Brachybacterium sp. ACRRE]|uniref:NAD(P)/FAD-dependent oxidoreductase n=1 Tax=Brachybacterium sp. ACRRE TaxID=2918184 RepID=UPI001EF3AD3E|nr:FAD-dependent oxidoreductase [Brachybacterium sp. ACRRE]MCG7310322.1 FAD-dependent oxidoreductase [Brachybacterium sp. ACRRE]
MTHRILVLGAGYAGTVAAGTLARRLRPDDARITLVNAAPDFVERVRMHELAVGHALRPRSLAEMFSGTAVDLVIDRVTGLDTTTRRVTLTGGEDLEYDSLVLALGSAPAPPAAEVADARIRSVGSREEALRLRTDLAALPAGSPLSVVGAGLTGLEAATEIAESRPDLRVTLHSGGEVGAGLSARAVRHLRSALGRLGIKVREGLRVETADRERVRTVDGSSYPADLVLWSSGFAPSPLAGTSDLETHADGRVLVDRALRSLSHPEVLAVGDAAWARGPGGSPLRMSCASGIPMGWQAAETLVAELRGRSARRVPLGYFTQCLSLGRRDGLIQPVHPDDTSRRTALTGKAAALTKEQVCRGAAWAAGHPTLGLPVPTLSARSTVGA